MEEAKDFKKPLGQWTEEEVPVERYSYDPEKKRITRTTEMEKRKVMYIHAPKEKYRCKEGEHVFIVVDTHKYIFRCINCRYNRQVYPTTYRFVRASEDPHNKTGYLIHKVTGLRV